MFDGSGVVGEQQIASFVEEEENIFAFPPMEAYERAQVHKIATAYGLKSSSEGNNKKRLTVLTRTKRTGPPSKEKLAPIIRVRTSWAAEAAWGWVSEWAWVDWMADASTGVPN